MPQPISRVPPVRLDLLFYLVGLTFAGASALWSEFYGYRVWGNLATIGYLLAVAHTALLAGRGPGRLRSRWIPIGLVAIFAILVPTAVLVIVRSPAFVWGPWPWSFPAQPEVWVVERSARLLLDDGTPYPALGPTPHPDDYTPYGPAMTIYGLPRAILGDGPATDARLMFLAISVLCVVLTLRLLGWPRVPVLAAQLAVVNPITALTASVAGDDLPVIALIVLAAALVYRAGPVPAGMVGALVVNTKLTALPAMAVLTVAMFAHRGGRAGAIFLGTICAATVIIVGPVLAADPAMFIEHLIKFPAGLGQARSPAASPLPGHLIAQAGPIGHAVAIGLLGVAACAITAWLVLRPPRTPADTLTRIAVGLGAAIVLAPATRWGYLIYPLAMLGAAAGFAATTPNPGSAADTHAHGGTPVGPTESVADPDPY
ncbi:MAG TPA: glycosyltransferase 87 family protein [Actinophytocola sp.]|uniref:glycosyltransferase 87 family protein n=1 Tax=Actinophytocola sp. TaxID=1872138 RepID=UPI002DDC9E98|nr:glycosyltransferase 87 family protein [Actinophytocola sp.]HEV2780450.1 glycosyltransferase 87 family protein [Actinophytocola sp.]